LCRDNFLILDIFFEALNYETIEQKKAYDIAGLLGMFAIPTHYNNLYYIYLIVWLFKSVLLFSQSLWFAFQITTEILKNTKLASHFPLLWHKMTFDDYIFQIA